MNNSSPNKYKKFLKSYERFMNDLILKHGPIYVHTERVIIAKIKNE
jgi:hypothetical protein